MAPRRSGEALQCATGTAEIGDVIDRRRRPPEPTPVRPRCSPTGTLSPRPPSALLLRPVKSKGATHDPATRYRTGRLYDIAGRAFVAGRSGTSDRCVRPVFKDSRPGHGTLLEPPAARRSARPVRSDRHRGGRGDPAAARSLPARHARAHARLAAGAR